MVVETQTAAVLQFPPPARDVLAADRAPVLVGIYGDVRGREFPITKSRTSIGRHGDNDIVVMDPAVSRRHASIHLETEIIIRDTGARNGLWVSDRCVREATLVTGDVLMLGQSLFKLCEPRNRESLTREMERTKVIDGLTGVLDGGAFRATLDGLMQRARSNGIPLALVVLSRMATPMLARKEGQSIVDLLLRRDGRALRLAAPQDAVCGRVNHVSLGLALPGLDELGARALAERVAHELEPRVRERLVISTGALRPGDSADEFCRRAADQYGSADPWIVPPLSLVDP